MSTYWVDNPPSWVPLSYVSMAQPCRKGEGLGHRNRAWHRTTSDWIFNDDTVDAVETWPKPAKFATLSYYLRGIWRKHPKYVPVDRPDFCTCHGSKVIPSHLLRRNLVCLDQSHILLKGHEASDQIASAHDPYMCRTDDRLIKQEKKTLQEQAYTQNHPIGQECHGKFLHVGCPQLFMAGHGCETGIWM